MRDDFVKATESGSKVSRPATAGCRFELDHEAFPTEPAPVLRKRNCERTIGRQPITNAVHDP
jgi:hypothetical protein